MANPNFPIHHGLGRLGEYMPTLCHRRVAHEFPVEYPFLVRYSSVKAKEFLVA